MSVDKLRSLARLATNAASTAPERASAAQRCAELVAKGAVGRSEEECLELERRLQDATSRVNVERSETRRAQLEVERLRSELEYAQRGVAQLQERLRRVAAALQAPLHAGTELPQQQQTNAQRLAQAARRAAQRTPLDNARWGQRPSSDDVLLQDDMFDENGFLRE